MLSRRRVSGKGERNCTGASLTNLPLFFDLTDSALLPGFLAPSSFDLREPGRLPEPERGDPVFDSAAAASSASLAAASSAKRRSSCVT